MSRRAIVVFLIVLLGLAFVYVSHKHWPAWKLQAKNLFSRSEATPVIPAENLQAGATYKVKRVELLTNKLELIIETPKGDASIVVGLGVYIKDSLQDKIINLLNDSTDPRVVLIKLAPWSVDGSFWEVDFIITNQGKEVHLSEWIMEQP